MILKLPKIGFYLYAIMSWTDGFVLFLGFNKSVVGKDDARLWLNNDAWQPLATIVATTRVLR